MVLLLAVTSVLAQQVVETRNDVDVLFYGCRVYLNNKDNSPYSVDQPQAFLSQRAIEKRQRYHIPITEEDLPVNPAYVLAIQNVSSDLHVWTQSKWTNTLTLFCDDTLHLADVRNLSFVDSIVPIDNYYVYHDSTSEFLSRGDSLTHDEVDTSFYGVAYRQIALHNGHLLHNEGYRGNGMLIAVLDGGWVGFDAIPSFQNLYNSGRIVGTFNVVPHEDGIYNQSDHGTCCTSTIACNLEYEMVGMAPDADFAFIRTEDCDVERLFEEDFWIRGAEIADSLGADVITSSLGYTEFDAMSGCPTDYSTCDGRWSIASRAATLAAHKGIIVCVAAGNEGADSWHKVSRPGDADDILCVGAINVDSVYAYFSSCGPSYDGRVKPDVAACGWGTYVMRGSGNVEAGSGTSFATPIIAGLSACLWQAIPQLDALEIMQIIRESGNQYQNPDTLLGYGIPDFYAAWQHHHTDGVQQYQTLTQYAVSPNPCRSQIRLSNPKGNVVRTALFDLYGRQIMTTNASGDSSLQLNLENLPSGLYLLKITDQNNRTEIKEIVKE